MNAFLRSHRVLAVKKEFVAEGKNSFWTFCVEYLDGAAMVSGSGLGGKPPKVDYKEVLKPEEFQVFSRLRGWRKGVAEKEGVPVYAVLTNAERQHGHQPDGFGHGFCRLPVVPRGPAAGPAEQGAVCAEVPAV